MSTLESARAKRLLALAFTVVGLVLVCSVAMTGPAHEREAEPVDPVATPAHTPAPAPPPLGETLARSDLDADGAITEWDFWILTDAYGTTPVTARDGDSDGDGDVDATDVYFHLVNFAEVGAFDLNSERIIKALDEIGYLDDFARIAAD